LIPDLDIYRAAMLFVDQHGAEAVARATECADGFHGNGDPEGAAIWRAILAAIEDLRRGRGPAESLN
jgi:hypothetical protein